jgi:hypothetical protein
VCFNLSKEVFEMAQDFYEFDQSAVDAALEVARRRHDNHAAAKNLTAQSALPAGGGHVAVAAQCISVTVENNQVCINLPLGLGKHCLPLPVSIPNGTAAEACLDVCTKFGIPTGVKVSIKVAGSTVISETFGIC